MKHLKLGHKIFLVLAGIIIALIAVTYLTLSYWVSRETYDNLNEDLKSTRSTLLAILDSRQDRLAVVCGSVAESPRFKAAIEEQDPTTVQDQAKAEREIVDCDIVLATGRSGQVLGWVGPGNAPDVAKLAGLSEAQGGKRTSGLWLLDGRLYQVAALPVRFRVGEESGSREEVAGALAIGEEVDEDQAGEIRRMTRTDVLWLLPDGKPGPSTFGTEMSKQAGDRIQAWLSTLPDRARERDHLVETVIGGQRHLVLAEPLDEHGRHAREGQAPAARVLLLRNLDKALGHLGKIQTSLLGAGALAVVVALLLSLILVHAITVPIGALVRGAQEVGRGNYDFEIKAESYDEIGLLAQRFDEMRVNLKDYISRVKEGERVKRDLELARKIQESLLPKSAPSVTGVDLAGSCAPANAVGGDYFDFIALEGDRVALMVADVSGHNVGAALMMAMSRSVMRTTTLSGHRPGQILDETNRVLFDDLVNASLFFSAFHAIYSAQTRELTYSNAGHNPPFVVRADEPEKRDVTTEGMLIGLMPDFVAEEATRTLRPGDVFVMYTDGIIEATNATDELYGEKRLVEGVRAHADKPSREIIKAIFDDVAKYTGGAPLKDDCTLMVMRVV